ncbi:energy-coupled thiamine transporter ThiT [Candidatus Bathyarchaeota archaeon]|nr:energy-coupled thiamine transporter ThiT [Candidatus Bathyarchaeota archaeon]
MNKIDKLFSTRIIAEVSIFVALATALSFIKIYTFPQGGSVTAGSMVPILWLALRRGTKIGLFTGAVYGIVQLLVLPYVYHPIQVLLDYPLAFGILGIAGFFQKKPLVGLVLGISGRFVMHLISGVVFFGIFAPEGMSPIIYSAIYNGSYLIPEIVISGFIVYTLQKSKALNSYL